MDYVLTILAVIGVCMVLSCFFWGVEAGVLALNQLRIRQLKRAGNPDAEVLNEYLERPENFLWTILIGNTLANLVAVGLITILLHHWLGEWQVWLVASFAVVMFLFYALCELLPKMLFRMYPNRLSLALARPFGAIHLALSPLVLLITKLSRGLHRWTGGKTFTGHLFGSREEMRLFMQESTQGLSSEERQIINRVLDLQHITVGDATIPLEKVATVTAQTTMAEVLKLSQEWKVSRLPVWRGDGADRRIVGIVSLRAVMYQAEMDPDKRAGDYLQPAFYMEEDMPLEAALKRMQRSGQRMGIVLGRDKREVGVVSLQDVLKLIFGEVRL